MVFSLCSLFSTYFVNLTELNTNPSASWRLEYSFRKDYGLQNLRAADFDRLIDDFTNNATTFQKYLRFNGVNYNPDEQVDHRQKWVFTMLWCSDVNQNM